MNRSAMDKFVFERNEKKKTALGGRDIVDIASSGDF